VVVEHPRSRYIEYARSSHLQRPSDVAHETNMSCREVQRKQQTTKWYVHAYPNADDLAAFPLDEGMLGGIQFGGKRNCAYGEIELTDIQIVDLDKLDHLLSEVA